MGEQRLQDVSTARHEEEGSLFVLKGMGERQRGIAEPIVSRYDGRSHRLGDNLDNREFAANIVQSLAWPAVAAYFLWLVRGHLGALVARLEELTLPGGVSAKFNKIMVAAQQAKERLAGTVSYSSSVEALRAASDTAKPLSPENQAESATASTGIDQFFALASISPEAAIVQAYNVLESVPDTFERKIPSNIKHSPQWKRGVRLFDVIRYLHHRELLDSDWTALYDKIRQMRNLAAHTKAPSDLTLNDALNYQSLCRTLSDKLFEVFNSLSDQE